jgi:hypothetical protein
MLETNKLESLASECGKTLSQLSHGFARNPNLPNSSSLQYLITRAEENTRFDNGSAVQVVQTFLPKFDFPRLSREETDERARENEKQRGIFLYQPNQNDFENAKRRYKESILVQKFEEAAKIVTGIRPRRIPIQEAEPHQEGSIFVEVYHITSEDPPVGVIEQRTKCRVFLSFKEVKPYEIEIWRYNVHKTDGPNPRLHSTLPVLDTSPPSVVFHSRKDPRLDSSFEASAGGVRYFYCLCAEIDNRLEFSIVFIVRSKIPQKYRNSKRWKKRKLQQVQEKPPLPPLNPQPTNISFTQM